MKMKMVAARTDQQREDILRKYRAAGDPFCCYFPPRIEPLEGENKQSIVPFKASKQVMLGDLMCEGKIEHRSKLARHWAED